MKKGKNGEKVKNPQFFQMRKFDLSGLKKFLEIND